MRQGQAARRSLYHNRRGCAFTMASPVCTRARRKLAPVGTFVGVGIFAQFQHPACQFGQYKPGFDCAILLPTPRALVWEGRSGGSKGSQADTRTPHLAVLLAWARHRPGSRSARLPHNAAAFERGEFDMVLLQWRAQF